MADPRGFLTTRERELPARRPVDVRIKDWKEVYEEQELAQLQRQGYLEKVRAETVRGSDGSAQAPAAENRWGPRAEVEIGEQAIGAFVVRMFGAVKNETPQDSAELEKLMERAAGTPLVG